ncbi:NAD-dependent epimerase/dehydratase family protein, partial [Billgrantia gudaonensis]
MKIVVTGANGLLGRHIRLHLAASGIIASVVALDRQAFNDDARLAAALKGADVVIHCAGINRDDERVVLNNNREHTRLPEVG